MEESFLEKFRRDLEKKTRPEIKKILKKYKFKYIDLVPMEDYCISYVPFQENEVVNVMEIRQVFVRLPRDSAKKIEKIFKLNSKVKSVLTIEKIEGLE